MLASQSNSPMQPKPNTIKPTRARPAKIVAIRSACTRLISFPLEAVVARVRGSDMRVSQASSMQAENMLAPAAGSQVASVHAGFSIARVKYVP